jgi:hypothetical protein
MKGVQPADQSPILKDFKGDDKITLLESTNSPSVPITTDDNSDEFW